MGKRNRPNATWYVFPLDKGTNEVIARQLSEDDACHDQLCNDGKKRNLWRCDHPFVAFLKRSSLGGGLRFMVFVREGQYGQIRPWKLEELVKHSRKKPATLPPRLGSPKRPPMT